MSLGKCNFFLLGVWRVKACFKFLVEYIGNFFSLWWYVLEEIGLTEVHRDGKVSSNMGEGV